jgi:precorrin-4 methylase
VFVKSQIVLVDTNVILEAHRVGCWAALCQYFALHTVEKVVEETQTGFQNRSPEQTINEQTLRKQLKHVEHITDLQRAAFTTAHFDAVLDDGERDLVIYAGSLSVANVWLLNSPDIATIRHASRRNWLDQLISLEEMRQHLNPKAKTALRTNYTRSWLSSQRTQFRSGSKI